MDDRTRQSRKIRWGILGCAQVAENVFAPGIQASRNGRVLAVASRNLAKAQGFATRFAIERAYGSYEALLDDPDIEAVYIPLPNHLHCEWTVRAAQLGKHVLCEKPLACNAQEAQVMVEACHRHGMLLMEAFPQRFQPQNLLVQRMVQEGRIGNVLWMTIAHASPRPTAGDIRLSKAACGGVLMDKGCYCVNQARFIFGEEPAVVHATAWFGDTSDVDERVTATLCFPSGGVAQFEANFALSMRDTKKEKGQLLTAQYQSHELRDLYYQSYELFGETGRILVPKGLTQLETYTQGKVMDTSFFITDSTGTEEIQVKGANQYLVEAEFFAECVLAGGGLAFPAEDGLANMRVIDAIYRSARESIIIHL